MVWSTVKDKAGKIVLVENMAYPYQTGVLREIRAGAIAVVMYRDRNDVPGQGMYYTRIGFDESLLTVPVVESFELFQSKGSLYKFKNKVPAEGLPVSILAQENLWKKANDVVGFQIFFNVLLTSMEFVIIVIAIFRLSQWIQYSSSGLKAIGPVCLILELIAGILRFSYTIVDPFNTFRAMPSPFCNVLITAFIPFQLSVGILLTFFWAEALTTNKVEAVPFISEHKVACFVVIALLFIGEIICDVVRVLLPVARLNPVYFTQAFYVIISLILTVCFIICAVQISARLPRSKTSKTAIRALTLRFVLSTGGYISFIILTIMLVPWFGEPWGWKIILNLIFLSSNVTGLLQVYSFIPPQISKFSFGFGGSSNCSPNTGDSAPSTPGSGRDSLTQKSSAAVD